MDFTTIEHNETFGEDWRGAFHDRVVSGIAELKQEREVHVKRRIYLGPETYIVHRMTDEQIETVARREAEQTCERAIREQDEAKKIAKLHKGEAL